MTGTIEFMGKYVSIEYVNAYKDGYRRPYSPLPEDHEFYKAAYYDGQADGKLDRAGDSL